MKKPAISPVLLRIAVVLAGMVLLVSIIVVCRRDGEDAAENMPEAGAGRAQSSYDPSNRMIRDDPPALDTALVRDNDYDPRIRCEPLPPVVRERIVSLTRDEFERCAGEGPPQLSSYFGAVYRVDVPNRTDKVLYVYLTNTIVDIVSLVVHDPATHTVTAKPFRRNTQFASYTVPPRIRFDDIDQDGQAEIVFQEGIHRGTDLSWIMLHYLHITEDCSLVPVLEVPTASYIRPSRIPDEPQEQTHFVVGTVKKREANCIEILYTLSRDKMNAGEKVILRQEWKCAAPGEVFVEMQSTPYDKLAGWIKTMKEW